MTPESKRLAETIASGRIDEVDDDYLAELIESAVLVLIMKREAEISKAAEAGMEAMGFEKEPGCKWDGSTIFQETKEVEA